MDQIQLPHSLQLSERSKLTVTAVSEVMSFDENAVMLQTPLGTLLVQGQELRLKHLSQDGGKMAVEGQICALSYEEPRETLWRRFFG